MANDISYLEIEEKTTNPDEGRDKGEGISQQSLIK